MSEYKSDEGFAAIVPPTPKSLQQTDAPGLAELSDRDQVWDKHRANADKVCNHYRSSKDFNQYSERISFCSQLLDFRLVPEPEEGVLKLKLSASRFCRVRTCPVCQWRRSLMWKAKAYQALPKVTKDFPKHRWLFLTLTVKNCPVEELRSTLNHLNKSFVRLTKLKDWPADGWIKSVEVTRGRDGNAHPHLHALLMVPASYFGAGYVSQDRWVEMWRSSARLDYNPQTHIKAIAKHHNPTSIVPEILKYQVKESDLVANREWFLELTKQLHKTRAVAVGGVLRGYMKELECEPEDLVGNTNEGEVDEGHLYFGWRRKQKKYKLVN